MFDTFAKRADLRKWWRGQDLNLRPSGYEADDPGRVGAGVSAYVHVDAGQRLRQGVAFRRRPSPSVVVRLTKCLTRRRREELWLSRQLRNAGAIAPRDRPRRAVRRRGLGPGPRGIARAICALFHERHRRERRHRRPSIPSAVVRRQRPRHPSIQGWARGDRSGPRNCPTDFPVAYVMITHLDGRRWTSAVHRGLRVSNPAGTT